MTDHIYKCTKCKGEWPEKVRFGKTPPRIMKCPNCGADAKRQFSPAPFFFRGGKGFY